MRFIGTCSSLSIARIAESCTRRADKRLLHKKVKEEYPELYKELSLHLRNPYDYYQNDQYYVLVHSAIDYVFEK